MLLLGFSVVRSQNEHVLGISAFAFGMLLIAAGVVAYFLNLAPQARRAGVAATGKARAGSVRILCHGFDGFHGFICEDPC